MNIHSDDNLPHHDRTSNANSTVVARLIKPSPIMLLAEQPSFSLTVPRRQWTYTVTATVHTQARQR